MTPKNKKTKVKVGLVAKILSRTIPNVNPINIGTTIEIPMLE
jgi:hypothetical protein